MMNFIYENQGANTYLVYEITKKDNIDSMSLGMLTNNRIEGFASTFIQQMDASKYIKYNISSKVSMKQFFTGIVNRKRLLGVLSGIVNGLLSAEEYMIDSDHILLDTDYIYVDVSNCDTELICIPIDREEERVEEVTFFKNIVFSTQYDQSENCDYVAKLINYLNSMSVFSLGDFKKIVDELKLDGYSQMMNITENKGIQQSVTPVAHSQQHYISSAVSSQQTISPVVSPQQNAPVIPPQQNVPVIPPQQNASMVPPQQNVPVAPLQQNIPVIPPQQNASMVPPRQNVPVIPPQPPVMPGQGFAVPGSSKNFIGAIPKRSQPVPNVPKKNRKKKEEEVIDTASQAGQEEEISLFYLMQHYSKENAAKYKAQKELYKDGGKKEKKDKKNKKEKKDKYAPDVGIPVPGMSIPNQGGIRVPDLPANNASIGYKPKSVGNFAPVTEKPVQKEVADRYEGLSIKPSNFGETVVLNGGNIGETTVLNAGMQQDDVVKKPYLVRKKNGERILLDKPIFRIGKERSYVDYFIGDNPAISRGHANIITKEGEYYIIDTNSTNHTFVNGEMIQSNSEVRIIPGNTIRLSNEEFELQVY